MTTKFSEQESLTVINEMIAQAKNNLQKGAANSIILWGYTIASIAILNFILLQVFEAPCSYHSYWVWLLTILISFINRGIERKQSKEALVKTHIDKIIHNVWVAFGYSLAVLFCVIFGSVAIFHSWEFTVLITPIILSMTGLGMFVTATACRFKLFYYSAAALWAGALLSVLSFRLGTTDYQFLILAATFIVGFIIPGYIMNSKAKQNV